MLFPLEMTSSIDPSLPRGGSIDSGLRELSWQGFPWCLFICQKRKQEYPFLLDELPRTANWKKEHFHEEISKEYCYDLYKKPETIYSGLTVKTILSNVN